MGKGKVVYILGYGHSGSTLLDLVVGSSPDYFSVGELIYLKNRTLGLRNVIERERKAKAKCSCGKEFQECPFWEKIVSNVGQENLFWYKSTFSEKIKLYLYIFFGLFNDTFDRDRSEVLYSSIIREIRKSKKNVIGVVDSSKNLRRLAYLSRNKNLDVKVIHMVRDGRGVINSMNKRGQNSLKTYFAWIWRNLAITVFLKRHMKRGRYITLSYDLFAQNPEKGIVELNNKFELGIDIENYIEDINKRKRHNFAGNRKVWNNKVESIKYDQSWRSEMPKWKQYLFSVLLYVPNRIWVYR